MHLLIREPIDIGFYRERLARHQDGAVVVFEGVVRNSAHGKTVLRLEYHAYETMALAKLGEVSRRALEVFEISDITIVHRLGRLELGECSVAVLVASPHRSAAFEACRFAIDTLKKTVPIWKKEFYEDGEVWIEGGS